MTSQPPTGAIGDLVTTRTGPGRVHVIRADAKVWISVALIREIREGRGAACVTIDGDRFTVDADNLIVSYRLGSTIRAGVNGGGNSQLAYRIELRAKTAGDPFTVATPDPGSPERAGELGRLVTHRRLEHGWPCRWCAETLERTGRGALICLECDRPKLTTT